MHSLRAISTDSSDHAPLLLELGSEAWAKPRFRFEKIWLQFDSFLDTVRVEWLRPRPDVDACRRVDARLRAVARALKSWSASHVGSVRLQLAAARAVIFELDVAQESRSLSSGELELRRDLKANVLGLASLARTIARQRARSRFLAEGDASTRFFHFHLQACHRQRKNQLPSLSHNGVTFTAEEAKADLVFSYYNDIIGKPLLLMHRINLRRLPLPSLDLDDQVRPFTADELLSIVRETNPDRTPGPDGFTGGFFKAAWDIVKDDILAVFQAMWSLDSRSFYLLNGAIMVLLRKKDIPSGLKDYRPISLIHSISKLFSKGLAMRLAPRMVQIE